jgi:hypothetical protein
MESFTPRNLIAGHLKGTRKNAMDAAATAAAGILGTENVALVCTWSKGDDIWYLATAAADLASHPEASCALGAALPGDKGHEGDGAYQCELAGGLCAVVVKQGDALHSFVGTPTMAQRFAQLEGAATTHSCSGPASPWQFPLAASLRRAAHLQTAITASGLVVAVLAALAWGWAAYGVSQQDTLRAALQVEHQQAWDSALTLLKPPANPKALTDLQKAVAQAVQEKGALVQFEYHDGHSSWTLNANGRVVTGASN